MNGSFAFKWTYAYLYIKTYLLFSHLLLWSLIWPGLSNFLGTYFSSILLISSLLRNHTTINECVFSRFWNIYQVHIEWPWSPLGVCFNLSNSEKDQIALGVCGEVAGREIGGRGSGAGRVKRQHRSGFTSLPAFLGLLHHLKSNPPHPSSLTHTGDRVAKQEWKNIHSHLRTGPACINHLIIKVHPI